MPRHFNRDFLKTCPWIRYDLEMEKAFCSFCKRAKDGGLKLYKEPGSKQVKWSSAWVEEGWNTWGRSSELMSKHQDSSSHRHAVIFVNRLKFYRQPIDRSFQRTAAGKPNSASCNYSSSIIPR